MSASATAAASATPSAAHTLALTPSSFGPYVRYDDPTPCEGRCAAAHLEREQRQLTERPHGADLGSTPQGADVPAAATTVSTSLNTMHSLGAALDEATSVAESARHSESQSKPDPWTHLTWQQQERESKPTAACICWRLHEGEVQFLLVRSYWRREFSVIFHRLQECHCVLPAGAQGWKKERVEADLLAELEENLPHLRGFELDLLVRTADSDAGFMTLWAGTVSVPAVWRKSCCNMRRECARRNYALSRVREMLQKERARIDRPEPRERWSIPKGSLEQRRSADPHEQQRQLMLTGCRELNEEALISEDTQDTTDYVTPDWEHLSAFQHFIEHKGICLATLRADCPRLTQDEWEIDPARTNYETTAAKWYNLTDALRLKLLGWMHRPLRRAEVFCAALAKGGVQLQALIATEPQQQRSQQLQPQPDCISVARLHSASVSTTHRRGGHHGRGGSRHASGSSTAGESRLSTDGGPARYSAHRAAAAGSGPVAATSPSFSGPRGYDRGRQYDRVAEYGGNRTYGNVRPVHGPRGNQYAHGSAAAGASGHGRAETERDWRAH